MRLCYHLLLPFWAEILYPQASPKEIPPMQFRQLVYCKVCCTSTHPTRVAIALKSLNFMMCRYSLVISGSLMHRGS